MGHPSPQAGADGLLLQEGLQAAWPDRYRSYQRGSVARCEGDGSGMPLLAGRIRDQLQSCQNSVAASPELPGPRYTLRRRAAPAGASCPDTAAVLVHSPVFLPAANYGRYAYCAFSSIPYDCLEVQAYAPT